MYLDLNKDCNDRAQYFSHLTSISELHSVNLLYYVVCTSIYVLKNHLQIFWQLSASEQSAIAAAAANPSSVLGGKIMLKGESFMVLRADESAIYCRKVRFIFFNGSVLR
jgi:hypothetical protein